MSATFLDQPADLAARGTGGDAHTGRAARGADRRGPFRPAQLISPRSRMRGESLASVFRGVDAAVILVVAWLLCALATPQGVWRGSVAQAFPYFASAAVLLASLAAFGAYDFRPRESLARQIVKVLLAAATASAALGATALLLDRAMLAAWPSLMPMFLAALTLHLVWRGLVASWRAEGRLTPNIVIVGATAHAERLIKAAMASGEAAVLGLFDDRKDRAPSEICGVPVLGDVETLMGHRILPFVDRIVITVPSAAQARVRDLAARLRTLPNDVTLLIEQPGDDAAQAVSRVADAPLARISGAGIDDRRAVAKRLQDLAIGSLALALAAPLMALIALAIRLDSPGPVFFRQRRHGFNNEDITVWKFRSMRHELRDEKAERQVSVGDDRVTRVGRFIRATSLDELPQLFNVIRGEMSLVGPRPHSPTMKTGDVESAKLVAEYAHRHRVKPGMTGWAAIKGSRGPVDTPESVRRRVALDIEYIERQSFWLDLYVIVVTLPCLLGDRQAAR